MDSVLQEFLLITKIKNYYFVITQKLIEIHL